jgi:hypothetical protein
MVAPDGFERTMGRSARAHVILGMHLDEAGRIGVRHQRIEVLRLEADAGLQRQAGAAA